MFHALMGKMKSKVIPTVEN